MCLFTKNLSQVFGRWITCIPYCNKPTVMAIFSHLPQIFTDSVYVIWQNLSQSNALLLYRMCSDQSFTAAQMLYHCFQKPCWGSYIKKTCLLSVESKGGVGWVCPNVLPMLLCLNMPGTLFDAEADMQVNICPQFIVTQLAQREPSGRIISVIVADRCARNSAPPPYPPLESLLRYYSLHYCAYCYK